MDARLDLVLDTVADLPVAEVWAGWTRTEHLPKWFTPKPWQTTRCEIDLRPGGAFRATMRSPEGQEVQNEGCYLEVIPERRLVWTNAIRPGLRPAPAPAVGQGFLFTVSLELEPMGNKTRYVATAMHADEAGRAQHEAMGFVQGWAMALDQLVAHMRAVRNG